MKPGEQRNSYEDLRERIRQREEQLVGQYRELPESPQASGKRKHSPSESLPVQTRQQAMKKLEDFKKQLKDLPPEKLEKEIQEVREKIKQVEEKVAQIVSDAVACAALTTLSVPRHLAGELAELHFPKINSEKVRKYSK